MKRTVLVLLIIAGVAHADRIAAPAGWQSKPEQAAEHAAKQRRLSHFGGAATDVTVAVYAPAEPGIVLYVTTIVAPAAASTGVRAEVSEHRLPAAGPDVTDSTERADEMRREIESRFTVRDRAAQLLTASRMILAADGKRVVATTGDCIARDDIAKPLLDACTAALATLDPEIPAAERVPLSLAATPAPSTSSGSPSLSPRLDDGSRINMPPIVVPQDSQTDRRPIYFGAGLVALALVFWWNRKRRERFAREDAVGRGEAPPEPVKSGDADADGLHAAAAEPEKAADKESADDR